MLKEDKGQPESWPTTGRISNATANCNITPLCLESLHWFFLIPPSCKQFHNSTLDSKVSNISSRSGTQHRHHAWQQKKCAFLLHCLSTIHPQGKKKKGGTLSLHAVTSHSLHGNSIPEIGCHNFWPRLIAHPKQHPTYPAHGNSWPRLAVFRVLLTPMLITLGSKDFICEKLSLDGGSVWRAWPSASTGKPCWLWGVNALFPRVYHTQKAKAKKVLNTVTKIFSRCSTVFNQISQFV